MKTLIIFLCFALYLAQVELCHIQPAQQGGFAETSDDSQSENDDESTVFC